MLAQEVSRFVLWTCLAFAVVKVGVLYLSSYFLFIHCDLFPQLEVIMEDVKLWRKVTSHGQLL